MSSRDAISSLSRSPMNPYLELLYTALGRKGIPRGPDARLDLRWLLAHRNSVRFLHAHWPEGLWRYHRGALWLRPLLAWPKLVLLSLRLALARALGYRILWTVHQLVPHETTQPTVDRVGARLLAAASDVLLVHDEQTAEAVRRELGVREKLTIIPHGNYSGVYPPGRSRDTVRKELGAGADDLVALCFGELRADSDVDVLVAALPYVTSPRLRLVVAGNVKASIAAMALERTARDPRVVRLDGFVPFEGVRELFGAADVAVVARGNGGTSGSLVLALSLGVPVIAADMPPYRLLLADGRAGWLFTPKDAVSLANAVIEALEESGDARRAKALAAAEVAAGLRWEDAARGIVDAVTRAGHTPPGATPS